MAHELSRAIIAHAERAARVDQGDIVAELVQFPDWGIKAPAWEELLPWATAFAELAVESDVSRVEQALAADPDKAPGGPQATALTLSGIAGSVVRDHSEGQQPNSYLDELLGLQTFADLSLSRRAEILIWLSQCWGGNHELRPIDRVEPDPVLVERLRDRFALHSQIREEVSRWRGRAWRAEHELEDARKLLAERSPEVRERELQLVEEGASVAAVALDVLGLLSPLIRTGRRERSEGGECFVMVPVGPADFAAGELGDRLRRLGQLFGELEAPAAEVSR